MASRIQERANAILTFALDERWLATTTNVQKGSGTIWTFDDELARLTNVQIVPDPFWTLAMQPKRAPTAGGVRIYTT